MFDRLRRRARTSASRTSRRARATCCTGSSTRTSTRPSRCSARWATSSTGSRTTSSRAGRREIVRDISNAKQEIINFRRIVRPQRAVLRDLERTKQRYLAEELEIYFDDISDAAERIWDTLENYKEVVEALESTNESVLSPPPERLVQDPDRGQRRAPAADAHREHLRHERRTVPARTSRSRSWRSSA